MILELFDTSRYAASPAQARYIAAKSNAERRAALVDMPEATVTFYERPLGEELFDLS